MKIERILQLVHKAKDVPNAVIEYSGELPEGDKNLTPTCFYGVKAVFNKRVPSDVECNLINRY
jgi:hypothetical protein